MSKFIFKINPKIITLFIILISLVILSTVISIDNRMNPHYDLSKIAVSSSDYEKIISKRQPVESSLVKDIFIDDQKLIYDNEDNTFYCSLIENEDYSHSDLILEHCIAFRRAILGDYIKASIIEEDQTKLLLYNGSTYTVSNLVFTTLPIINIGITPETFAANHLSETYSIEEYAPGELYLYDNRADFNASEDETDRSINSAIKIHQRGGTTLYAPQKSYRVTLLDKVDNFDKKEKKNLLGIRKDDDWILYSAYSDYEKIRNVFSMNLWHDISSGNNEWNAPVSNYSKYVELFFNGRYHGLYALSSTMDNKAFDINDGEDLFKKTDWSPSEISQGMTYVEYEDGGGFNYMPGYRQKAGYAYDTLHELYMNLAYSNDTDIIRQSIDIDNAIDLWLFFKITQGIDNIYYSNVKNLFASVKISEEGYEGHRLLFSPWDMDQSFGNRFVAGEGSNGISSYAMTSDYDLPMEWTPVYYLQSLGDEDINNEIKARYAELRNGILSDESIKFLISDYEADIYDSGAFERTMNRWPTGNYYDKELKLDDFETYVLERMASMDKYIGGLE